MNKEWFELNKTMQAQTFINADGYHSKTIAYSIWHIFRIEDIVAHTVINEEEQVFLQAIIKNVSIPPLLLQEMNL